MTVTEGEKETIECRPTKWFYLRALAMVGMFGVLMVLFLKDWKIGWPAKNEVFFTYQAFQEAKEAFAAHEKAGGGADEWKAFASAKTIDFPAEEGVLPAGVERPAPWPEVLTDYAHYKEAFEKDGMNTAPPLWTSYSDTRGWSSTEPAKAYSKEKIDGQLPFGIGSGVLMLVGLFFLIRTSRRTMKVDREAYHAPNGQRVAFGDIHRIDKRKWESKGLATLYCGDREAPRKLKVDGMVYGQFKPEDGAPAERLFTRILDNFTGELVELEREGNSPDEESPAGESER